jgi:hypothetical protein
MKLLDDSKTLLENPFFDTLANFIKKFKTSKSFYSIFHFPLVSHSQELGNERKITKKETTKI